MGTIEDRILSLEFLMYCNGDKNISKKSFKISEGVVSSISSIYYEPILINNNEIIYLTLNTSIDMNKYFLGLTKNVLKFKIVSSNVRESIKTIQPKDKFSNINRDACYIYGKYLNLLPDYRGCEYNIEIVAQDRFISKPIVFTISELSFPKLRPSVRDIDIILGKLNNNKEVINLNNYFTCKDLEILYSVNDEEVLSEFKIEGDFKDEIRSDVPFLKNTIKVLPYFVNYPMKHEEYDIEGLNINVYESPRVMSIDIDILGSNVPVYIDLSRYDTEFIRISDVNIVEGSIEEEQRQNVYNKEIEIFEVLSEGIIKVNPDYRGVTYRINLKGEGEKTYGEMNIYNLNITETIAPSPKHTGYYIFTDRVLFKNISKKYDLSIFFSSDNELYYEASVIDGIEIENGYYIDRNYIIITPNYRNISYKLEIYAYDKEYHVRSDFPIIIDINEDKPLKLHSTNKIRDIIGLGNSVLVYNLEDYIVHPFDNNLIYNLLYDTYIGSVTLDGSILEIKGDYRDMKYDIEIEIVNPNYDMFPIRISLNVEEVKSPNPYAKNEIHKIVGPLTVYKHEVNLDELFVSITGSELEYIVLNGIEEVYIENNMLIIEPNMRGGLCNIDILAKDKKYEGFTELSIEYIEKPVIEILKEFETLDIESEAILNLNEYFRSPINNILVFNYEMDDTLLRDSYVDASIKPVRILGSKLIITPDYRNISYDIRVTCVDIEYEISKFLILRVIERKPPLITPLEDIIYINKHVDYDIRQYFINIPYYDIEYIFENNSNSWIRILDTYRLYVENIPELNNLIEVKVLAVEKKSRRVISDRAIRFIIMDIEIIKIRNLTNELFRYDLLKHGIDYEFVILDLDDIDLIDSILIDDSDLLISPNFRNKSYKFRVSMRGKNTGITVLNIDFEITELASLTTTLTNFSYSIDMLRYNSRYKSISYIDNFESMKGDIVFEIGEESDIPRESYYTEKPAYELDKKTGQITFYNNFRNTTYNIVLNVYTTEYSDKKIKIVHLVKEPEIYPIVSNGEIFKLMENESVINLDKFFRNYLFFYNLEYIVIEEPNLGNIVHTNNLIEIIDKSVSFKLKVIAKDKKFNISSSEVILENI